MPIKTNRNAVPITVKGYLANMRPALGRPGCILTVTESSHSGQYYVPLSPHDCRREFPEMTWIEFQILTGTKPDPNSGVIETAGNAVRLWDIVQT